MPSAKRSRLLKRRGVRGTSLSSQHHPQPQRLSSLKERSVSTSPSMAKMPRALSESVTARRSSVSRSGSYPPRTQSEPWRTESVTVPVVKKGVW